MGIFTFAFSTAFLHWKMGIFIIPFFVNFGLVHGNFYVSLLYCIFALEDGNFYISLFFSGFLRILDEKKRIFTFPFSSALLHGKRGIFIFPCFFLGFFECWIRRWEFLCIPGFFWNFELEDGNFYASLIFLCFCVGWCEFLYFPVLFWLLWILH